MHFTKITTDKILVVKMFSLKNFTECPDYDTKQSDGEALGM